MDRFVILAVEYEPDASDAQRSLGWLVPELIDADLAMTDDARGVRKWAGVIEGHTVARLAGGWGVDGHLASYHTWDGMEWESGGFSPIVWVSLTVSEPVERDLPFVYVG